MNEWPIKNHEIKGIEASVKLSETVSFKKKRVLNLLSKPVKKILNLLSRVLDLG